MSALSELWAKLAGSKEYRHALVASELKRGLPRQIRILRKQHGREWNQQRLALEAGLTQGAISRAEDPDYGNLTLNNLLNIGKGLDVAFVGRFVPFSEFARWHASLNHESQLEVPSFPEDVGLIEHKPTASVTDASRRIGEVTETEEQPSVVAPDMTGQVLMFRPPTGALPNYQALAGGQTGG